MGNQVEKGSASQKTQKTQKITEKKSEVKENPKIKTVKRENLYAEDKLFENYESILIFLSTLLKRHKHLWNSA